MLWLLAPLSSRRRQRVWLSLRRSSLLKNLGFGVFTYANVDVRHVAKTLTQCEMIRPHILWTA